jgi:acyl-[acyl carrier protein]--UDP-N-acetylglucosamine O-acyltransferase
MRKHRMIEEDVTSLVNEIADSKLGDTTDEIAEEINTESHLFTLLKMLDLTRKQMKHEDVNYLYNMLYALWQDETIIENVKEDILSLQQDTMFQNVKNLCDIAYGAIVATFENEEEIY